MSLRMIAAAVLLAPIAPVAAQTIAGAAIAIDGDTLEVGRDRVRLLGIDAPEAEQTCLGGWINVRCGADAAVALGALVQGKAVTCEVRARDVYGRAVAQCIADGADLGEAMLVQGLAVALDGAPAGYRQVAGQAETSRLGIWATRFERPAIWRAANPRPAREAPPVAVFDRPVRSGTRERSVASPRSFVYRNCAQARAAGTTPLYRGQPGYGAHMDGDGDGIACEPYRGQR
jgi:endonuclease YncB( thermonuclease family)